MKKLNKGFTMIELLVIIAIIGILATTLTPKLLKEIRKATVAKIQHNLGVIRSKLSLDETLSDEFPNLFDEGTGEKSNLLKSYSIEPTPAFTDPDGDSYEKSAKVVTPRDNTGGWFYIRETGEIYANLPNGAYTKDSKYEIWEEENSTSIVYKFKEKWSITDNGILHSNGDSGGLALTKNSYSEYSIKTTATLANGNGYGVFIQSDEFGAGYVFQFDKGLNKLVIKKREASSRELETTYLDTGALNMSSDDWFKEHDVEINVKNIENSNKQNVDILVDGIVITNNYVIDKPDTENYTGFRSWHGEFDINSVDISKL